MFWSTASWTSSIGPCSGVEMHFLLELRELCSKVHLPLGRRVKALKPGSQATTNHANIYFFYIRIVVQWFSSTKRRFLGFWFMDLASRCSCPSHPMNWITNEAWIQIISARGSLLSGATAKMIWNGRCGLVPWSLDLKEGSSCMFMLVLFMIYNIIIYYIS